MVCDTIIQISLQLTNIDSCVFVAFWDESIIIVRVHVDDFIMVETPTSISRFRNRMAQHFYIKILGQAKFILGIQLKFSLSFIFICQKTYLFELIKTVIEESPLHIKVTYQNFSPLSNSIISNSINAVFATELESESLRREDSLFFRHIIGKLMYAMVTTHPDIAFAVNFLGRFMAKPYQTHLTTMLCLLRYISGTVSLRISYPRGSDSSFLFGVYSDSN